MNDYVTIRMADNGGYIVSYWCWIAERNKEYVFATLAEMNGFLEKYFDDAVTACEEGAAEVEE